MTSYATMAHSGTTPCRRRNRVIGLARVAEPLPATTPLDPRVRRTLELVYAVEGVIAVRVWQWGKSVAIGVQGGTASSPVDLVRRVEAAVAGLREPGEAWDFGILEGDAGATPSRDEARTT
jgi:hypothetical protein